jgi:hypothetical protein
LNGHVHPFLSWSFSFLTALKRESHRSPDASWRARPSVKLFVSGI